MESISKWGLILKSNSSYDSDAQKSLEYIKNGAPCTSNHSSLRTNTMSLIITDFAGSNHRVAVHTCTYYFF